LRGSSPRNHHMPQDRPAGVDLFTERRQVRAGVNGKA
jgi:hypothetical protein